MWGVSGTNGNYCSPNIQTSRDIREGKVVTLRHPKEEALQLPEIGIDFICTACGRHERQGV